jgi:hypothetical protein
MPRAGYRPVTADDRRRQKRVRYVALLLRACKSLERVLVESPDRIIPPALFLHASSCLDDVRGILNDQDGEWLR